MVIKLYKTAALVLTLFIIISLLIEAVGQEIFLPDNPLQGARVFEEKGCILCHAINNEGGKSAPDLGKELFHGGYLELSSLMWNHFPKMKSEIHNLGIDIPVFTQDEFEDLFAYLYCIPFQGEPGNVKRGEELLRQKQCLKCHAPKDASKFSAPDLKKMAFFSSPIFLAQAMWNHSPSPSVVYAKKSICVPEILWLELKFSRLSNAVFVIRRPAKTEEFLLPRI